MATLTVGIGQQFTTIAAAVAASAAGDIINVQAGTYINDFPRISHDLTLNAVGGMVKMVATMQPPNGKAIIDEGGPGVSVTITGFDISGATVPDGNGAAIRYEGGDLTLVNDTIHDNQEGILSAPDPNGSITIDSSTFTHNGSGTGFTHNIYVGEIASLTVRNSTITDAVGGHDIKSRAHSNTINNNIITDGPNGTGSYEIDLPNGGAALISGNVMEKGPNATNPNAISVGEEGNVYANSSLIVQGNTILNDQTGHTTTAVVNKTSATATISGNSLFGWSNISSGAANVSGNTILSTEPSLGSLTPGNASGSATPPGDTTTMPGTGTPLPDGVTTGNAGQPPTETPPLTSNPGAGGTTTSGQQKPPSDGTTTPGNPGLIPVKTPPATGNSGADGTTNAGGEGTPAPGNTATGGNPEKPPPKSPPATDTASAPPRQNLAPECSAGLDHQASLRFIGHRLLGEHHHTDHATMASATHAAFWAAVAKVGTQFSLARGHLENGPWRMMPDTRVTNDPDASTMTSGAHVVNDAIAHETARSMLVFS